MILIVFVLSYLLRVIYDLIDSWSSTSEMTSYKEYMFAVLTCIPFDLLPIFVVLLFHRRNLRQIGYDKLLTYDNVNTLDRGTLTTDNTQDFASNNIDDSCDVQQRKRARSNLGHRNPHSHSFHKETNNNRNSGPLIPD